jgi:biopolymer transport protein ExbD
LATWDVFHGDRLELERGLTLSAIREALAVGELREDDLVRPAGTAVAWTRLADMPQLIEPAAESTNSVDRVPEPAEALPAGSIPSAPANRQRDFEVETDETAPSSGSVTHADFTQHGSDWRDLGAEPGDVAFPVIQDDPPESYQTPALAKVPDVVPSGAWDWALVDDDDEDMEEEDADFESGAPVLEHTGGDDLEILDDEPEAANDAPFAFVDDPPRSDSSSRVALAVVNSNARNDAGALTEVPEEEQFSLSRSGAMTVEELDLAPMVDVAFQLVLFFMVAAQTILYKTLEIPKPSADQAPAAVAQGRSRSLDELKEDYILVEIDGSGALKIDREPVAANATALIERLRSAREATHRKAMLLSAEYTTSHRNAVLAYDAANEIGLGIVIAKPANPQGPAPRLLPAQPAAPARVPPGNQPSQMPN